MKIASTFLIFILLININEIICQSIIGTAAQIFHPCPDGFISMYREIGRPPAKENYWDGTMYLTDIKNLKRARIILRLTHPATLTVNATEGSVWTCDNQTFALGVYNSSKNFEFTVLGGRGKPYPNIANITLNGKAVCENPETVVPSIIGSNPIAVSSNTVPLENFVPYCGRQIVEHNELIIRGNNTKPGEWPWHVALYSRSDNNATSLNYRCGGTIINTKTVITAAHCVVNFNDEIIPVQKLLIVAGKYHLNKQDQWIQQRDIVSIKIGENFSRLTLRNDIAILNLNDNLEFNQYVQRICLWNDYEPLRDTDRYLAFGLNGTIAGWGVTENDVGSEIMLTSNLQVISDAECLVTYPSFFQQFLYQNSFCASPIVNGTGPCNGDSGGGLVIPIRQIDNEISYFLRGIISVTVSKDDKRVCDPNFSTIFTDVAQFVTWIQNNV